jgi:hypothetical protein
MKHFFFMLLFSGLCIAGNAQQVVSPAGSSHQTEGRSISWTMGETVSGTLTADNAVLTQGMQQPTITVTNITPPFGPAMDVKVFPNPVASQLQVELADELPSGTEIRLYNFSGSLVMTQSLSGRAAKLDVSALEAGVYFLRIQTGQQANQTFKIVKH